MRYFKLLTQDGWNILGLEKGNIYREDFIRIIGTKTIIELTETYPEDFEEVIPTVHDLERVYPTMKIEELLENITIPKIKFLEA